MAMRKPVGGLAALILAAIMLSAGLLTPSPAAARVYVGVGVGVGPYWGGPYPYGYPYPYAYAPYPYAYGPPVVVAPPPVIVAPAPEPAMAVSPAPQSWYYCDNPQGYYPTVTSCSTAWRQVPAQPH
jgi:hypothetical protein